MSNHTERLAQLEQGKTYRVKLTSGAWTQAEFLGQETIGGYLRIRNRTRYQFRNLASGRTITLRSRAKVREIPGGAQ